MYQVIIGEREAGQRFDKYLHRILPNAGSGFLYKMLRKKNIILNDRKADGSERIKAGDCVKIFFAQETLDRFTGNLSLNDGSLKQGVLRENNLDGKTGRPEKPLFCAEEFRKAYRYLSDISVIYENDHILIAGKPAGILSQKAADSDLSLNEWLIGYLLETGQLSEKELAYYKPSVCNRLDRNTSGMVLCAKTLRGAQLLGRLLKERTLHKYYQLYVKGHIEKEQLIEGYLCKDEKKNKVMIKPMSASRGHGGGKERPAGKQNDKGNMADAYIQTRYMPLRLETDKTLLEVELITGKPHQIRAHLASIGHPLLGDYKYGDRAWNEKYRQTCGVQSQLLHAYKVVFPLLEPPFTDLSNRTYFCELPDIFGRVSHFP